MSVLNTIVQYRDYRATSDDILLPGPLYIHVMTTSTVLQGRAEKQAEINKVNVILSIWTNLSQAIFSLMNQLKNKLTKEVPE